MQLQLVYCHPCWIRRTLYHLCSVVVVADTRDTRLQLIFCLNSMLAWLMKSPLIFEQLEKISYGYLKMDCEGDKCYGVLAVRLFLYLGRNLCPSRSASGTHSGQKHSSRVLRDEVLVKPEPDFGLPRTLCVLFATNVCVCSQWRAYIPHIPGVGWSCTNAPRRSRKKCAALCCGLRRGGGAAEPFVNSEPISRIPRSGLVAS